MKRYLGLFSMVITMVFFGGQALKAKSDLTPYQSIVLASAINYCSMEYGLITEKQAYRYIVAWVQDDHDLEPYQIYNLMQKKGFGKDTDDFIDKVGGCQKIASTVKESLARKPTGFSSLTSGKKDYEYFYKVGY
ncbi:MULTISPECIES: hypothetical protein [Prochlorococcus]|uniref:hypothetical protein n=1 Tax=Prochlorococcus TaxID=1218 RepID=UPI000533A49E|nr:MULTISPECIES: hypothetical protein [Prochlorococcus]KGG14398.1 hypothetical protein EV05_0005 [Prochlorococcus sp. MIT 0601]